MAIDETELQNVAARYQKVMILMTAKRHGRGIQRLPDRHDRGQAVAAIQVETVDQATRVLLALDAPERQFYLDVERKRDLNLMRIALGAVSFGTVFQIKPNDLTVDALQAQILFHVGPDLTDVAVTIYGTGNLGFKFALRLCETGARVNLSGRDVAKANLLASAINQVVPEHTPHPVVVASSGFKAQVLVAAVTAEHVVGESFVEDLLEPALCVDVGISNFSPGFISRAMAARHTCIRLDVRSAGDPLPPFPNVFFENVSGRRSMQGVTVVAGGLIGREGEIVLDSLAEPTRVVGVANGTGGLIEPSSWSSSVRESVARVANHIRGVPSA